MMCMCRIGIVVGRYLFHDQCNIIHYDHVHREFYSISLKKESPVLLFQSYCLILNKMRKNQKELIMSSF